MTLETAVDNDVLLKAACYGTSAMFWPDDQHRTIAVLGAAKFVLRAAVGRMNLNKPASEVEAELNGILSRASVVEPTQEEIALATAIESAAQRASLALDAGESQLCAITVERHLDIFETVDKRAIRGFETLLAVLPRIVHITGRVRCLEQIVMRVITQDDQVTPMAAAVRAEPSVDKTMNICFSSTSSLTVDPSSIEEGLRSYIEALRAAAPAVLWAC